MSFALGARHGHAALGLLVAASLTLGCGRSRNSQGVSDGTGAASLPNSGAAEQISVEPEPQPGVVTAVDSQTVHMLLPQPDVRVDPEASSRAPVTLPEGMVGVYGEDVLSRITAAGGKGTLVNVWASWCGACKVEMPLFQKLRDEYKSKGIAVLFVSVDEPSAAPAALRILQAQKIEGPALVAQGSLGYFKLALSPIWKGSLPATFLYDATGKLRYYWGTQVYEDEVKSVLEDFVSGKAVDGMANLSIMAPP